MFARVASHASTSANSSARLAVVRSVAERGGQLADLLHEPHERPFDAPPGILGPEQVADSLLQLGESHGHPNEKVRPPHGGIVAPFVRPGQLHRIGPRRRAGCGGWTRETKDSWLSRPVMPRVMVTAVKTDNRTTRESAPARARGGMAWRRACYVEASAPWPLGPLFGTTAHAEPPAADPVSERRSGPAAVAEPPTLLVGSSHPKAVMVATITAGGATQTSDSPPKKPTSDSEPLPPPTAVPGTETIAEPVGPAVGMRPFDDRLAHPTGRVWTRLEFLLWATTGQNVYAGYHVIAARDAPELRRHHPEPGHRGPLSARSRQQRVPRRLPTHQRNLARRHADDRPGGGLLLRQHEQEGSHRRIGFQRQPDPRPAVHQRPDRRPRGDRRGVSGRVARRARRPRRELGGRRRREPAH